MDLLTEKIKEEILKRANFRCERCWSKEDLKFYKIDRRKGEEPGNYAVLCKDCYNKAPRNPFVFKELFLRFSSPKEMLKFYKAESEEGALKKFCQERGLNYEDLWKEERRLLRADAIRKGMEKSVKLRGHAGFNIPYGYDYKDGKLVINRKEAEIVKNIYRWYISGKSIKEIAELLNSAKIPTKRGGFWAKKTISSILKNPIYCGYYRRNNRLAGSHEEKIIDVETFRKVQKILKEHGGKSFEL